MRKNSHLDYLDCLKPDTGVSDAADSLSLRGSVAMCTYNGSRFLCEQLESIAPDPDFLMS